MPMKPLYAGLITAAAIVGAILICVGCRRCQRANNQIPTLALNYRSDSAPYPRTVNGTGHTDITVRGGTYR